MKYFHAILQGGSAFVEGGPERGVRSRQTGGSQSAFPTEGAGADGITRSLAEESGRSAGAGKTRWH